MEDRDMRDTGGYGYVREVVGNVSAVYAEADVAERWAAEAPGADGVPVVSWDVYARLALRVAEAARMAAEDVASDVAAAAFPAAAALIAERLGAGDAEDVYVGWSDDTDAAEAVGFVVPVVATYGDAFAIVDAYGSFTWVADLAAALLAEVGA